MKSINKIRCLEALCKLNGMTYHRVNSCILAVSRYGKVKVHLYENGKEHYSFGVIPSPYTDIMTDCFCDTYLHTIKAIVAACA